MNDTKLSNYSITVATRPEPTVRPPSRSLSFTFVNYFNIFTGFNKARNCFDLNSIDILHNSPYHTGITYICKASLLHKYHDTHTENL